MGKTQVTEKDRPVLERLESIVKDAGHAGIGTTALSKASIIPSERIRSLFRNYFSQVGKKADASSKSGIPADIWVYKPTGEDSKAA